MNQSFRDTMIPSILAHIKRHATLYLRLLLLLAAALLIYNYQFPILGYEIKPSWFPKPYQTYMLRLVAPCAIFLVLYSLRKTWSFLGLCIAELCSIVCFLTPFPILAYTIYTGFHYTTKIDGKLIPLVRVLHCYYPNLNVVLFWSIILAVLWHILLYVRCKQPCFATSRFTAGLISLFRKLFTGLLALLLLLFVGLSLPTWLNLSRATPAYSGIFNSTNLFCVIYVVLFLKKRLSPTLHLLLPMPFLLQTLRGMGNSLLYFEPSPVKPEPLEHGLGLSAATPVFWTAFALAIIMIAVYFLYFFFYALRFPQPRIPVPTPEESQQAKPEA